MHDYISETNIILSNPHYNHACGLVPFKKFPFYYSCRLKACIFTESKLFYNTRSSTTRRCSGKYVILEILQNSQVNNCARSLELNQGLATLLKELSAQMFCYNLCEFFKNTFVTEYLLLPYKNKQFLLQQNSYFAEQPFWEDHLFL